MTPEARFKIGQQYKTLHKQPKVCTIIDIYRTYNNAGEFVGLRYVSIHQFLGQMITDCNVNETTIARGLIT